MLSWANEILIKIENRIIAAIFNYFFFDLLEKLIEYLANMAPIIIKEIAIKKNLIGEPYLF